jgi:hypothetical protein
MGLILAPLIPEKLDTSSVQSVMSAAFCNAEFEKKN